MAAFSALAAIAAAILLPASADATTVRMGDSSVPLEFTGGFGCGPCTQGFTLAQSFTPDGEVNFAPASGLITSWHVSGRGTLRLSVLESAPEGGWVAVGTSVAATNLEGQPNATSLPIGAGDMIGVDLGPSSGMSLIGHDALTNGEALEWEMPLMNDEMAREPTRAIRDLRLRLNADIVLAPLVSSLTPTSDSTAGGNAVKISGLYLDGASSVTFGSTPASSFSVDSSGQVTAIAPPSTASTVDVRVTGPGGSSEVSPADRYTFTAPTTTTSTTTNPTTKAIPGGDLATKPTLTGFSESSGRWRRGRSLPRISSAGGAPVGTTFSFSLNEPASVNLEFTQSAPGRHVAGRCVAPGSRNAGRPRCKRTLLVGSFAVPGHAGLDKVGFQGRLSDTKTLKPGSYLVSLTAREAHGLKVVSRSLVFTIIS
jgi:IPT/TIG domain